MAKAPATQKTPLFYKNIQPILNSFGGTMLIVSIVLMVILAGVTAYAMTKYVMQIKKHGPFIVLTGEYVPAQFGSFVQLRWKSRVAPSDPPDEFIVYRREGLQVFPSEIAATYEMELRDYDVSPGKTYTYWVYEGRDSMMGYDGKISNQVKITL